MTTFAYYGNFSRTWSTEVYIADALERAGYTVIKRNRHDTNLVNCDYLLCAKLAKADILVKAKARGIPTISWTFDLLRKLRGYNHPHLKADIIITTDGDDPYHTIRQGVHLPEKKVIPGKKIYDVIFVGNASYYKGRKDMIKRVKPKVFNNVRGLKLNKLLGQTKIVLGDSFPASNYWSNRVYEMTGRGGFLIHPKTIGLSDRIPQFVRGKEKEMINYYLEHEEEREKLCRIQFEKCPTYDDRIMQLINLLKTTPKNFY